MFITNEDYKSFKDCVYVLTKHSDVLSEKEIKVLEKGKETIDLLQIKRDADNKRKTAYMAEKRKIDKTYGGNDYRKRKMKKENK